MIVCDSKNGMKVCEISLFCSSEIVVDGSYMAVVAYVQAVPISVSTAAL